MTAKQSQISPTPVRLDPKVKKRLAELSKAKDRSQHWLMKQAIMRYLDEEERADQLKQETLQSWEDVKNGNVQTHEAVVKWIKSWGSDQEKEWPE